MNESQIVGLLCRRPLEMRLVPVWSIRAWRAARIGAFIFAGGLRGNLAAFDFVGD